MEAKCVSRPLFPSFLAYHILFAVLCHVVIEGVRLSFRDILRLSSATLEFEWRSHLSAHFDHCTLRHTLMARHNTSVRPILRRWATGSEQQCQALLRSLPPYTQRCCAHRLTSIVLCCVVLCCSELDGVASSAAPDVAARALCAVADVLELRARMQASKSFPSASTSAAAVSGSGYLSRSGASRNAEWGHAFELLAAVQVPAESSSGNQNISESRAQAQAEAVAALRAQRELWCALQTADMTMRAARHYVCARTTLSSYFFAP
jgi:hypothetical protein